MYGNHKYFVLAQKAKSRFDHILQIQCLPHRSLAPTPNKLDEKLRPLEREA